MRLKYFFGATIFLLLLAGPASGEIYQYTDESGVVRFTDDPSLIPENQQKDVKTIESVEATESTYNNLKENSSQPVSDLDATPAGELRGNARELDAINKELVREFNTLQEEREALGDPPSHTARTSERKAYNEKVMELNRKIDQYQERKKNFQEKVDAFNSRITEK